MVAEFQKVVSIGDNTQHTLMQFFVSSLRVAVDRSVWKPSFLGAMLVSGRVFASPEPDGISAAVFFSPQSHPGWKMQKKNPGVNFGNFLDSLEF